MTTSQPMLPYGRAVLDEEDIANAFAPLPREQLQLILSLRVGHRDRDVRVGERAHERRQLLVERRARRDGNVACVVHVCRSDIEEERQEWVIRQWSPMDITGALTVDITETILAGR